MNNSKSLAKTKGRNIIQIILVSKVIKIVNFLNTVVNSLLKPKKKRKSNSTIYFLN